MAGLHLVTGYNGTPHITSADQGSFNAGIVGLDKYVLGTGNRFKAEIVTANAVRIYDGDLLMNGRHVRLAYGEFLDCIVSNGTIGTLRNDLIVVRYNKHLESGVESVTFMVYQGSAVSSNPTDPSVISYDILEGTLTTDFPLYRVRLNGVSIETVEPLFSVVAPLDEMQRHYCPKNLIINSDFQCNTREIASLNISGTSKYTVDMWRGYEVGLIGSTNGIKIAALSLDEQGYFTQFVKINSLAEKYTLSFRVDGINYSFTTSVSPTPSKKTFDKFEVSLVYITPSPLEKYIKVNYCPLTTDYVTVGYIDLFEGEYVYPHVGEDYGAALARCKPYVQKVTCVCPIVYSYTQSSTTAPKSYKFMFYYDMPDTSSSGVDIDLVSYSYMSNSGVTVSGSKSSLYSFTASAGTVTCRTAFGHEKHADCCGINAIYIISCEPDL